MKAITIRQPWAWAIMNAGKDIENRSWKTNFRGRVAIHASASMTREEYEEGCKSIRGRIQKIKIPAYEDMVRGAILGTVEIIDCVDDSDSTWFGGEYGFVLSRPKKLPEPIRCKGALMLWNVPRNITSRINRSLS